MKLRIGKRITVAASTGRHKAMAEIANGLHSVAFKQLLKGFIDATNPDLADRFKSPELNRSPVTKAGGGYSYTAYTGLRNHTLSVEVIDGASEITVKVGVVICDPFTDKEKRIIDVLAVESVAPDVFDQQKKETLKKVVKSARKSFFGQVAEEQGALKAQLEQLTAQAKHIKALIGAYTQIADKKPKGEPEVPAKARRKS